MTKKEELSLMLGFLVKQEQQEEERENANRNSTPKYSSNQEALRQYDSKLKG